MLKEAIRIKRGSLPESSRVWNRKERRKRKRSKIFSSNMGTESSVIKRRRGT